MNCTNCRAEIPASSPRCHRCGAPAPADAASPSGSDIVWNAILANIRGSIDGKYAIQRLLGRGGMAAVYLAKDVKLGRHVALKIMAPTMLDDPTMVERFRQEARTVAQLSHPNIITVFSVEEVGDIILIVMEYLHGPGLDTLLQSSTVFPPDVVRVWLSQAASALDYAHQQGIVHRDIKPANLILNRSGDVVVTDFGIAKSAEGPQFTQTGMTLGTPAYMSPEQCRAAPLTGASDQYALGILGYEMLCGAPPFQGPTMEVIHAHLQEPPPPLRSRRPDCPADLEAVIDRMLAKEPANRWPRTGDIASAVAPPPSSPGSASRNAIDALRLTGSRPDDVTSVPSPWTEGAFLQNSRGATFEAPPSPVPAATPPTGSPRAPAPGFDEAGLASRSDTSDRQRGLKWRWAGGVIALLALALLVFRLFVGDRGTTADTALVFSGGGPSDSGMTPSPSPIDEGETMPLVLSVSRRSIALGDSVHVQARGGEADIATEQITWRVDDPTVASVVEGGWLLGRGVGTTTVIAMRQQQEARTEINVEANAPVFVALEAGASNTCGVTSGGGALCWGGNGASQVSERFDGNPQLMPWPVARAAQAVAVGGAHACALLAGGAVRCWGQVSSPTGRYRHVTSGDEHVCALTMGNTVECWGDNRYGQLGDGSTTVRAQNAQVLGGGNFDVIASGAHHTCGLTSGTVYCWGRNDMGQTGIGGSLGGNVSEPLEISGGLREFAALTAGDSHTCALSNAGWAFCWGSNDSGQLGDGSTRDRPFPRPANGPMNLPANQRLSFERLVAGAAHTCGITTRNWLYCWGDNTYGQLGDGTTEQREIPTRVLPDKEFVGLTAGAHHTCAVDTDGTTLCWGRNDEGQLGDGSRENRLQPVIPGVVTVMRR